MTWAGALGAYFGVSLSKESAELWWAELKQSCKDISNDECVEAIRQASWDDRSKYSGKPTLKDVRMWVFRLRKSQREEMPDDGAGCEQCNRGWLDYRRKSGQYAGCGIAIPCLCSAGQTVAEAAGFAQQDTAEFRRLGHIEMARRRDEFPQFVALSERTTVGELVAKLARGMNATVNYGS